MKNAINCPGTAVKWIVSVLIAITIICAMLLAVSAGYSSTDIIDNYDYPVVPATAEWENPDGFAARLDACRIPQKTLDKMSANALVDAVLGFLFLPDLLVCDS